MGLVGWILIFLGTVMIHEVAHGAVAYLCGDRTAKIMGRLSLNPLKHIDWFWTVAFPAMLFISTGGRFMIGMAKPVPVNFSALHHPKRDMIWVALAGPLANVVLAKFLLVGYQLTGFIFFLYGVYFSLGLAVFNMLPIPPLDGSRVAAGLLPRPLDYYYLKTEPYGFLIVMVLYFTGFVYYWIIPGINLLAQFLNAPMMRL
ncbi:MAG: hypothetical protein A3G33_08955 [Omnitrophica bacterium RIFCSPLOWO2_12_FULL_44_17]|uniref:Peptidase M50 domain-containing protein n=1 Tax=Candidatus Danuiimicrobium aquiferis TaxID=1801832 RepID=A0A1G1L022_9BACT|nr:MAG: hypothetical protein A3B72_00045 [Omnitrophica bacterium RIFCSPHIGHO2_02_FULL_45_28]OGW88995.1 MAG: hypothetical protein A3E74_02125 [Omnitrophica bacterium RIFCSPHIGHO2_12_FULL_44_12]OGW98506.1 MAG: hypothetical protein A3G33_08955 [Omnitrophica bacterium RIFCSPLOWO2_12_FULL_44_17]OGX05058.1 MAG: hypothetical protein A3J12_08835 [Omnitrophica bacterium RIFCSPLOWO2_02_FULL_44_11]